MDYNKDDENFQNKISQRIFYDACDIAQKEFNLFLDLRNCNCCIRHNQNKPQKLLQDGLECSQMKKQKNIIKKEKQCKCSCRHTMRSIVKQYSQGKCWYYNNHNLVLNECLKDDNKEIDNDKLTRSPEWTPGWHNY
jgi:hypothetical protein